VGAADHHMTSTVTQRTTRASAGRGERSASPRRPTLVPQTVGAGVVGPYGAAADRHDRLVWSSWPPPTVSAPATTRPTTPSSSTHGQPPSSTCRPRRPCARDDNRICATRVYPALDAATSSSPLVERQRAADTDYPVPRPGLNPSRPGTLVAQQGGQPSSRLISQRCHYERAYAAGRCGS
jgi:hypothetical protein